MTRIFTVLGARPQFIKAATVTRAIRSVSGVTEVLVHTGQHYDTGMSEVFFDELGIPTPDFHLGINGGGHGEMTGAMLQHLEPLLFKQRPDVMLVYGDTNSTLAGALAASKLHIPVAHVEAGLRSYNRQMPEEQNRIVTDHLSEWLFSSTDAATRNLRHEGLPSARIYQVGDVMYDAALLFGKQARMRSNVLERCGVHSGQYILATVHRAENTDDGERLNTIMQAFETIAMEMPVILPLHPRTRAAIKNHGIETRRITFIDPVSYLDMVGFPCPVM